MIDRQNNGHLYLDSNRSESCGTAHNIHDLCFYIIFVRLEEKCLLVCNIVYTQEKMLQDVPTSEDGDVSFLVDLIDHL